MREYDTEHRNYVNFLENQRENDEERKCKKDLEGVRYRGQRAGGGGFDIRHLKTLLKPTLFHGAIPCFFCQKSDPLNDTGYYSGSDHPDL